MLVKLRRELLRESDVVLVLELKLIVVHAHHLQRLRNQQLNVVQVQQHPPAKVGDPFRKTDQFIFICCLEDDLEPLFKELTGELRNHNLLLFLFVSSVVSQPLVDLRLVHEEKFVVVHLRREHNASASQLSFDDVCDLA